MPITIDGEEYFEGKDISHKDFFEKQVSGANIKTAQPAVGFVEEFWENLLKDYDSIIYVPMSSALSSSCESAKASAEKYGGKVIVVDNKQISCSLKLAIQNASLLQKQGKSAQEIAESLMGECLDSTIYISIPTLTYLKKGGRLTPAAAILGTMLSIKPVLQIQRGKLDSFAKCFTFNSCKVKMIQALKKDIETRFANKKVKYFIAHTDIPTEAEAFKEQLETALNVASLKVQVVPTSTVPLQLNVNEGSAILVLILPSLTVGEGHSTLVNKLNNKDWISVPPSI